MADFKAQWLDSVAVGCMRNNPTTKYLCARKLVPSRQHVQRNLLLHSHCAHSKPQFISVMWPDLGDQWGRTEERAVLSCGKSTARSFL